MKVQKLALNNPSQLVLTFESLFVFLVRYSVNLKTIFLLGLGLVTTLVILDLAAASQTFKFKMSPKLILAET